MPNPLVTILVAAFNGERFLAEALESAFAQAYEPFEVVFVDDGSEDRTADIARTFPVRYLRQENSGLPAARNAGLTLARGELVCFLDADDVLPPTKVPTQVAYLEEHAEIGCVLGRQEWIVEGIEPPPLEPDPIFGVPGGIQFVSAMIRRSVLDELGGFDPTYRYAEDRDLFIRMRERGIGITVLPEIVLHKRLHGSNMTLAAPTTHPMLRSLREKLERERAAGAAGDDQPNG
jgi:glycosyltransferase involved in cell wall biosynthesis